MTSGPRPFWSTICQPSLTGITPTVCCDPSGAWKRATGAPFAPTYALTGDALKRPPPGFDATHPLIEDLKRKDFVGETHLSEREVTRSGFLERYAELCRDAAPLLRFLCRAAGVPF